jgi:hypothetical protein
MNDDGQTQLDIEIELIESSLLPDESLSRTPDGIEIKSTASKLFLHINPVGYPEHVVIEVKGPEIGREEAEGWKVWVEEKMKEWNSDDEYVHMCLF